MPEHVVLTEHARFEMERRLVDEEFVLGVTERPEQVVNAGKGRLAYQSRYLNHREGKEMLVRLIVERREETLRIITVYKTSKIEKYWRMEAEP